MPDIFISYAQADRERVALIAEALESAGYDLWWDRALEPGQTFRGEIANNLKSAKVVLVVWSKTSVRRNFVIEEAEEGLERDILVPVMIDDVVREIPHGFRSVQAANLVKWRGDRSDPEWKLMLSQVRRKVENPSKPPRAYNPPKISSGGGRAFAGLAIFLGIILAGVAFLYFTGWRVGAPTELATQEEQAPETETITEETPSGSPREFTVTRERKTMFVRVRRVAVYTHPDTQSNTNGAFEPGEEVLVTGRVDEGLDNQAWYQVVAPDGSIGYVLVTTLREDEAAESSTTEQGSQPSARKFRDCAMCPEMVVVPAGSFQMGDLVGNGIPTEYPIRTVELKEPFAVGIYEVSFAEWDACVLDSGCTGYRPGDESWGRNRHPVINVSWRDAQSYVTWLSRKTGKKYRLLSEAEWEYVARGGTDSEFSFGDNVRNLCNYGNFADSSTNWSWSDSICSDGVGGRTAEVGTYRPNPFGLFDVHGNVWEWVADCWNSSHEGAPRAGRPPRLDGECSQRVVRGGSWINGQKYLRSSARVSFDGDLRDDEIGFRVSMEIQ